MTDLFAKRALTTLVLACLLAYAATAGTGVSVDDTNGLIQVTCGKYTYKKFTYTLESLPPLNRYIVINFARVKISYCPPPSDSYATALWAVNINVNSIDYLRIEVNTSTDLNETHFTGLSVVVLEVDNLNGSPVYIDVSKIETLNLLRLWGSIRSLPQSQYIESVNLYNGESSGAWSECAGLKKLVLMNWRVSVTASGWLSRCRRLRELHMYITYPSMVRLVLAGGLSLDTLTVRMTPIFWSQPIADTMLADVKEIRDLNLYTNYFETMPSVTLPPMVEGLDLSFNSLRNTTALLAALAPLHKLRRLKLDMNKDLDFCADETPSPPPFEELHLSNTKLQRLDCFGHWESLKLLDVTKNGIMMQQLHLRNKSSRAYALAATVASLFPDWTRRVRLAGNVFVCSCDNRPLLEALRSHRTQVEDYDDITCAGNKEEFLADFAFEKICDEMEPEAVSRTVWLAVLAGLLLTSAAALSLAAALCWRYKRQLRVFLLTRGCCLDCLREEEADADAGRQYDIFVSFCHLDDQFVNEHLLPGLQDYKLCIHYRDWIAGEFIATQIARSIQQSRRTIIVLSRHFLDSLWGMLEFRTAHASTRQEGRPRLVAVLLDGVLADARLDAELCAYLDTNTYVVWGERYFWHKLRFALPRRQPPDVAEPATVELADRAVEPSGVEMASSS